MNLKIKEVGTADRSSKSMGIGQDGVALLTVMMIMLILTVLGIAAITTTGLENRMAGFARTGEEAAIAADSCLGVGANIITLAFLPANALGIPPQFLSTAAPPGPVPAANAAILIDEIFGKTTAGVSTANSPDTATGVPNLALTINGLMVNGDIDFLFIQHVPGSGTESKVFRITCIATNVATGSSSSATAVYACTFTAGECQK
jgi:hypothetical protein